LPKAIGVLKTGQPADVDTEMEFVELGCQLHRSCDDGLYTFDELHMVMKHLMGFSCNGKCVMMMMTVVRMMLMMVEVIMMDFKVKMMKPVFYMYCKLYLKKEILQTYEGHTTSVEVKGQMNFLCFKDMVSHIITTNKWYECSMKEGDASEKLVRFCKINLCSNVCNGLRYH
jgi:hypothetical protein